MDCRLFTKEQWFTIARIIDNDFNGSIASFSAVSMIRLSLNTGRSVRFYLLSTNLCDECSVVRAYYNQFGKIYGFCRIAGDTDGYQEIHGSTANRVLNAINSFDK